MQLKIVQLRNEHEDALTNAQELISDHHRETVEYRERFLQREREQKSLLEALVRGFGNPMQCECQRVQRLNQSGCFAGQGAVRARYEAKVGSA